MIHTPTMNVDKGEEALDVSDVQMHICLCRNSDSPTWRVLRCWRIELYLGAFQRCVPTKTSCFFLFHCFPIRIHVGIIYLHEWLIFMVHVGILYTMHGSDPMGLYYNFVGINGSEVNSYHHWKWDTILTWYTVYTPVNKHSNGQNGPEKK